MLRRKQILQKVATGLSPGGAAATAYALSKGAKTKTASPAAAVRAVTRQVRPTAARAATEVRGTTAVRRTTKYGPRLSSASEAMAAMGGSPTRITGHSQTLRLPSRQSVQTTRTTRTSRVARARAEARARARAKARVKARVRAKAGLTGHQQERFANILAQLREQMAGLTPGSSLRKLPAIRVAKPATKPTVGSGRRWTEDAPTPIPDKPPEVRRFKVSDTKGKGKAKGKAKGRVRVKARGKGRWGLRGGDARVRRERPIILIQANPAEELAAAKAKAQGAYGRSLGLGLGGAGLGLGGAALIARHLSKQRQLGALRRRYMLGGATLGLGGLAAVA